MIGADLILPMDRLDAPADKLTLARSRQVTLDDWQRPRKNPPKA